MTTRSRWQKVGSNGAPEAAARVTIPVGKASEHAQKRKADEPAAHPGVPRDAQDAVPAQARGEPSGEGERVGRHVHEAGDDGPLVPLQERGDDLPLKPGLGIVLVAKSAQMTGDVDFVHREAVRVERRFEHRGPGVVVADPYDRAPPLVERSAEMLSADETAAERSGTQRQRVQPERAERAAHDDAPSARVHPAPEDALERRLTASPLRAREVAGHRGDRRADAPAEAWRAEHAQPHHQPHHREEVEILPREKPRPDRRPHAVEPIRDPCWLRRTTGGSTAIAPYASSASSARRSAPSK